MTGRLRTLARYNAWANHHLYAAAAALPDEQYRADRGAFFKSVNGTLNHLLATDRIWMRRFTGEGAAPDRLDAILFDDLPSLHAARQVEDTRIVSYVDGLEHAALAETFTYARTSSPERYEHQLGPALDHFFNHQTHHRGQVHAVLTGLGADAPSLDLILFHREVGFGGMKRIA